jgi:hypothetical protein
MTHFKTLGTIRRTQMVVHNWELTTNEAKNGKR